MRLLQQQLHADTTCWSLNTRTSKLLLLSNRFRLWIWQKERLLFLEPSVNSNRVTGVSQLWWWINIDTDRSNSKSHPGSNLLFEKLKCMAWKSDYIKSKQWCFYLERAPIGLWKTTEVFGRDIGTWQINNPLHEVIAAQITAFYFQSDYFLNPNPDF